MSATVPGNIRHLQSQINRAATSPFGPVSLGPGDHLRVVDPTSGVTVFQLTPAGALHIRVHGSLQHLGTAMETERTQRITGDNTLQTNINTLSTNLTDLINLRATTASVNALLALKASIASVQSAVNSLTAAINASTARVRALELDESVTPGTGTPIPSPPVITT